MSKNVDIKACLLLLALNTVLIWWYFGPLLMHLNTSIINSGGDGFKNYFTYWYFIKFDWGHDFTGMGYPFSEHMTFTDNMPAISWTLAKLRIIFPSIADYSLFTMHSLLIISFPVGSYYCYRILKSFKANSYWAAISGTFIIFLSPQVTRFAGHYGMALVCILPMYIYFLNGYAQQERKRYLLLLFILGFVSGFLHIYNLGIGLVLCIAYFCSSLLLQKGVTINQKLRKIFPPFAAILLSVILLKLTLSLTDEIKDRPQFPPGILNACTSLKEILTSTLLPLGYTFQFLTGNRAADFTEGYVYIGFVSIISLIIIITISIIVAFRKKNGYVDSLLPNRELNRWLVAALFCLTLALGIPFIWGIESVLDHISSFRQLRTLGRFAWPFYYIVSIYICIFLNNVLKKLFIKKNKKGTIVLAGCIVILWTVQASGYATYLNSYLVNSHDNYVRFESSSAKWAPWLKERGYDLNEFQASIGLPFFYIGTDKIGLEPQDPGAVHRPLAQLALAHKLPMVNVMMSRASWKRGSNMVRLFDGPYTSFPYIDSFNSNPLLLIKSNTQPIENNQAQLLNYSKYIGDFEGNTVYSFDIQAMIADRKKITDSTLSLVQKNTSREGLLEGGPFYYTNHFDNNKSYLTFAGKGALGKVANHTLIATIQHPFSQTDQDYTLSIWSLCDSVNDHLTYFDLKQYDSSGNLLDQGDILSARSTLVLNFWFKAERLFKVKAGVTKIEIYATGYHDRDNHIAIDEIAMWPIGYTYFYKDEAHKQIFINNRPIFPTRNN